MRPEDQVKLTQQGIKISHLKEFRWNHIKNKIKFIQNKEKEEKQRQCGMELRK